MPSPFRRITENQSPLPTPEPALGGGGPSLQSSPSLHLNPPAIQGDRETAPPISALPSHRDPFVCADLGNCPVCLFETGSGEDPGERGGGREAGARVCQLHPCAARGLGLQVEDILPPTVGPRGVPLT